MASSQLELCLLIGYRHQMDVSRIVLIEWHRLQKNVITCRLRSDFINQIDDFVDSLPDLESVGIHLLANLAFKPLPVE